MCQLKERSYALVILILFLSFQTADCMTTKYVQPEVGTQCVQSYRQLQITGERIVDKNGDPVQLRGIYTRAEWLHAEQEVVWFKQWGVNFVRILLTYDKDYWQVINDGKENLRKRCILREENLAEMDKKCGWLEKNDIYYIIEVPWRWYGITQKLKRSDLLSKQCSQMYRQLAERYKKMEYLIGFCMFSEIYVAPELYRDYKDICTSIIDAVHSVDSGYFVSATGVAVSGPQSLTFETRIERPNVIYDFHYYDVKSFTHYRDYYGDMRYPGRIPHGFSGQSYYLDKHLNQIMINTAVAFSKRWKVPIWCGEFGAFNDAPDGSSDRWIRDVCYILESHDIPWILWTWKPGLKDVPQVWKDLWQGKPNRQVTISPHGGRFTDPLIVKIESWIENAPVYYTLDGSEPNTQSLHYQHPIQITDTTTVRARIIANDLPETPIDTALFEFGGRKSDIPADGVIEGLDYQIYEGAWKTTEQVESGKCLESGTMKGFKRFQSLENDVTLICNGYLRIDVPGRYFFYPKAAGAYALYIGDQCVCLHEATQYEWALTSPGIITLESGMHVLKIVYSRPKGIMKGFALSLQRDTEPVKEPFKVDASMLYRLPE